jgi:hypothetical protein
MGMIRVVDQYNQSKMNWRCDSSNRAPALQARSSELNSSPARKKIKINLKMQTLLHSKIWFSRLGGVQKLHFKAPSHPNRRQHLVNTGLKVKRMGLKSDKFGFQFQN